MKKQINTISKTKFSDYIKNNDALITSLSHAKDVFYVIDTKNTTPLYSNQLVLYDLGYSDSEIKKMGKDWIEKVTHPNDYGYLAAHAKRYELSAEKSISRVVYRMRAKEGSWHVFENIAIRLSNKGNGWADIVIGIMREVTHDDLVHKGSAEEDLEYRCRNCKKLLGVEKHEAEFEIKCLRCGEFNRVKLHNL